GSDIVIEGMYNPKNPYIPGLPSKELRDPDDEILAQVQADLGRGWTLRDLRELIGCPIGVGLYGTTKSYVAEMEPSFGGAIATRGNAKLMIKLGADIIDISDWGDLKARIRTINEIRNEIKDKAILSFSRIHGPGLFGHFAKKGLITKDEITEMVKAGIDIVNIPAVGTFPGYTINYASRLVGTIHDCGALAGLGIGTSQEGSDIETIRRIGFYSKMAGADIYGISDAGLSEAMPAPENIMALSTVIRGKRHTYLAKSRILVFFLMRNTKCRCRVSESCNFFWFPLL
ncbi:unnamed protein product, partial [marine sediment metagenome]